jgi:hypothetical protein
MANYRRGPNVSEFIANLNAIPSAQDMAQVQDNFNLDEELAMFTNTQFFDFDLGQDTDLQPSTFDFSTQSSVAPTTATETAKALDFIPGMFHQISLIMRALLDWLAACFEINHLFGLHCGFLCVVIFLVFLTHMLL